MLMEVKLRNRKNGYWNRREGTQLNNASIESMRAREGVLFFSEIIFALVLLLFLCRTLNFWLLFSSCHVQSIANCSGDE